MGRVRTAESGLEEWACPSCGRRILLRWPPHYVKHVLDHGDEKACHIARIADDAPADDPDDTGETGETGETGGTGPGELGETPVAAPAGGRTASKGEHCRGTRRWLRETGAAALHAPARGLNPAEPV
ncbi:hypothetical protein ABZ806_21940 [Spirillospora sp. NPDC047418]